jgi:hypothetical protein
MPPADSASVLPDAEAPLEAPPDYDSWYSALISFVFHFLLVLAFGLITSIAASQPKTAPAVDIVRVAASASSGGDSADDAPGQRLEATPDQPEATPTPLPPAPTIDAVAQPEIPEIATPLAQTQERIREQVSRTCQEAAAARSSAAKTLDQNLGGGSPAAGGGGSGSGRAGRAARWVLRFNTSAPTQYLAQLGGLGAEIAFPRQGDKYTYFSNLAGTPQSSVRTLASETRIYWMPDDPPSYQPIAARLGVSSPELMILFLPTALEEKMVKLEKAYQGAQDEDDILQTVFECVGRGGSYEVIVVSQKLRGQ